MGKPGYVYLMASRPNGTLYLGATSNLPQRSYQHRSGLIDGFSKKHGCETLVWFEAFDDLDMARERERQMKKWKRNWKLRAIEEHNPGWSDLFETL
ncbi:MAG: GIY-YIG nuclease family protein [Pseudomonadota bacterium]